MYSRCFRARQFCFSAMFCECFLGQPCLFFLQRGMLASYTFVSCLRRVILLSRRLQLEGPRSKGGNVILLLATPWRSSLQMSYIPCLSLLWVSFCGAGLARLMDNNLAATVVDHSLMLAALNVEELQEYSELLHMQSRVN